MKGYDTIPLGALNSLQVLGRNIRLARRNRKFSTSKLASLAGTTRETLRRIETGNPGVGIGYVVSVLWVLGLSEDIKLLAAPERDQLGLALMSAAKLGAQGTGKNAGLQDFDNDF